MQRINADIPATMPTRKYRTARHIVLFGEAGTALSAAACLRGHHITVVSSVDEPRLASLSRFVRNRVRLSKRSSAEAIACLESLRGRDDNQLLLFPCSDAWIEVLSENLDAITRVGKFLPATPEHLALTLSKAAFLEHLNGLNLPGPVTFEASVDSDWEPSSYPFVLKPISTYKLESRIGVKGMVIQSPQDWLSFDKTLLNANTFIAQEYLEGASISVCFCTSTDGNLAASYVTEKIHFGQLRSGTRVATVTRADAVDLASRFVRDTRFVGFGELEMIESSRGLVLLELNARPWSQVLLSDYLGIPILEMAVSLMTGEKFSEYSSNDAKSLEWIAWDNDILFRHFQRRAGRLIRPSMASKRIYAQSFFRDPIPAFVYALTTSRIGPGQLIRRLISRNHH